MGTLLICGGFICILVGGIVAITRGASAVAGAARQPIAGGRPAPAVAQPRKGDTVRDKFFNARLGQTLSVKHPERGNIADKIQGSIIYAELWQTQGGQSPWVPTGNQYAAHWCGTFMVYEWQDRLYLFDQANSLSDQDINASFMPFAKQYAQSNQTAEVTFAWPPTTWTIKDIGKFRVARAEGQGLRLNPNAEGRFIHAHEVGSGLRALAVEDYQSGAGGRDTAWIGWQITWKEISRVG